MSKQKYYGILMGKYQISSDIYLLTPNYIISGQLDENEKQSNFVDEIGNKYPLVQSVESVFSNDITLLVSYLITEEELLSQYSGCNLKEAKYQYFQKMLDYVHIGYYQLIENKIVIRTYDIQHLLESIGNENVIFDGKGELSNQEKEVTQCGKNSSQERLNGVDYYFKKLKEILQIQDEKSLRHELESFSSALLLNCTSVSERPRISIPRIDFNDLNGEKIIDFFDECCRKIIVLDNMNSIYEMIRVIEKNLNHLILEFEILIKDDGSSLDPTKILGRIKDCLFIIVASGDVEQVRKDIIHLHREEATHISQIADFYDRALVGERVKKQPLQKMIVDPNEMKAYFDKIIVGQEEAKKKVISAIIMNDLSESCEDRNHCILVGPTGSGKTLIIETIKQYLNIPMVIVDTTQHTIPGYVGANIDGILTKLLYLADGNKDKAEHGIVVFDELDKKGSEKNDDVSGKGVLNTFLNFIHGTDYDVKYEGKTVTFNTSHLNFFATGAFADVVKAKLMKTNNSAYKETSIGFGSKLKTQPDEDIEYPELFPQDFVKYGQIPGELMGRFNVIVQLSGHTKESLKNILIDSEISPLLIEKRKLEKLGISLEWTEEFLDEVVKSAMKEKEGARSLKRVIEKIIHEVRWEVLTHYDILRGIRLVEKSVENPKNCQVMNQDGSYRDFRMLFEDADTPSEVEKVKKMGSRY